jgi:hypothetical protein
MTLQEADKTGRKYRRKNSMTGWDTLREYDTQKHSMDLVDALADDWEVEPEVYEVECMPNMNAPCGYLTGMEKPQHISISVGETIANKVIGKRCAITIKPLD